MNTPGRETFYLVWIECPIASWKVHLLALISPGRDYITRLITIFHIQTAHYLVLCTNVKHDVGHRLSEYGRKYRNTTDYPAPIARREDALSLSWRTERSWRALI